MKTLKGSCLCHKIQYQILDNLEYSVYCHCSECRKFSGSSFSILGGISSDKLKVTRGEEYISYYEKTKDSTMVFCKVCGSSLYVIKPNINMIHLRLGTLDMIPSLKPQAHVYVGSKAEWEEILDDLPKFKEIPVSVDKKVSFKEAIAAKSNCEQ